MMQSKKGNAKKKDAAVEFGVTCANMLIRTIIGVGLYVCGPAGVLSSHSGMLQCTDNGLWRVLCRTKFSYVNN